MATKTKTKKPKVTKMAKLVQAAKRAASSACQVVKALPKKLAKKVPQPVKRKITQLAPKALIAIAAATLVAGVYFGTVLTYESAQLKTCKEGLKFTVMSMFLGNNLRCLVQDGRLYIEDTVGLGLRLDHETGQLIQVEP